MVYIKKSEEVMQFMKKYDAAFKSSTTKDKKSSAPKPLKESLDYIPYEVLKRTVEGWNKAKPAEKVFLHKLFKQSDIVFTCDYDLMKEEWELPEETKELRKRLELKKQEREYQKLIRNITNPKQNSILGSSGDIRDIEKSVSFGVSFIFTLFLSSLSGFYIGKYFLGLTDIGCFVLSAIALVGTLFLETILFMLKSSKIDKKVKEIAQEKNKYKLS